MLCGTRRLAEAYLTLAYAVRQPLALGGSRDPCVGVLVSKAKLWGEDVDRRLAAFSFAIPTATVARTIEPPTPQRVFVQQSQLLEELM